VKGISAAQLASWVWPSYTYGALASRLPLVVVAESCGYRNTIALGLLLREATRVLLVFGQGAPVMALMQVRGSTPVQTAQRARTTGVAKTQSLQLWCVRAALGKRLTQLSRLVAFEFLSQLSSGPFHLQVATMDKGHAVQPRETEWALVDWMGQVCYAGAIGVEPVFFAYAYSVTDAALYQRTTALLYGASHSGNLLGSAAGQLLVDYTAVGASPANLTTLFVVSWLHVTLALVAFLLLLPTKDIADSNTSVLAMLRAPGGVRELAHTLRRHYSTAGGCQSGPLEHTPRT